MFAQLRMSALVILGVHTTACFSNSLIEDNLNRQKVVNVTLGPVGFAIGSASLGAEFKLSEHVTFGPSLSYVRLYGGQNMTAIGGGVVGTVFLSGMTFQDSWIASAGVDYYSASNGTLFSSGLSGSAQLGHWWFWPSGLNLGMGLGVLAHTLDLEKIGQPSIGAIVPSCIFKLGWSV